MNRLKKQNPMLCYLQKTHFRFKDIHGLKVKGYKMIFHDSGDQKSRVVTLISEKASVSSVQFSHSVVSDSL